MIYYTFEGRFEIPDDTTYGQMKAIKERFEEYRYEYCEDGNSDYVDMMAGEFRLSVDFDEDCEKLSEFLALMCEYDVKLTDIEMDGRRAIKPWTVKSRLEDMKDVYLRGNREDLVESMVDFMTEDFPKVYWGTEVYV